MPLAVRLRGRLDAGVLEQALADVVGRHEALRTSYPGSGWRSRISVAVPRRRCPCRFAVAAVAGEAELRAGFWREFGRAAVLTWPSDLPLRAVLLELSAQDHVLLLVVHHIAFDGWSITPLMRDLGTAYAARAGRAGAGLGAVAGAVRGLRGVAGGRCWPTMGSGSWGSGGSSWRGCRLR